MPKIRVTVSLSKDLVEWLDQQISERVYKDRSHAIEKIVFDLRKQAKSN